MNDGKGNICRFGIRSTPHGVYSPWYGASQRISNNITIDRIIEIKIHRRRIIGLAAYGIKYSVRTVIDCAISVLTAYPESILNAHINSLPFLFICYDIFYKRVTEFNGEINVLVDLGSKQPMHVRPRSVSEISN